MFKTALILATSLLGLTALAVNGGADDEETVTLDDVPAAVKAAIERATKGVKIKEIEKESEGGNTIYEVETSTNGIEVDLMFNARGQFVGFEAEVEDEDDGEDDDGEDDDEDEDDDGEDDDGDDD